MLAPSLSPAGQAPWVSPILDHRGFQWLARGVTGFLAIAAICTLLMIVRLAAADHTGGGIQADNDLARLGTLYRVFVSLLSGLILSGFGLIYLLYRNNHLLTQAHAEVHGLLASLRRTSDDLTTANERVNLAMIEVGLQNAMLNARDDDLRRQNSRFDAALNNITQALCMADTNQCLIVCNARFLEMFGLSPGATVSGTLIADIFSAMRGGGLLTRELIDAVRTEQQAFISARIPGRFQRETPGGAAIAVSHQPMADGGWVATFEDMTEQRRTEARIQFMAHHDALTRLPNRVMFHERMTAALADPQGKHLAQGGRAAVFCLDLDYFKTVNDTLGHPAGDALLEAVTGRLHLCIRDDDVLARLGADEFGILRVAGDHPDSSATLSSEALARHIVDALSKPYDINGHRVIIGVSVGVAIAMDQESSPDTLLKCADLALYRAKADGGGRFCFFEPEMDTTMRTRRQMELDLREALERHELELYFQPFIDLKTNTVSGFEALLRWYHPGLGMVSPAQFIPLAEEMGLIVPIGEWVLREACAHAMTWPAAMVVAVNLSPVQFGSDNLLAAVELALAESGLAPNRLELEITETALLRDNETVLATLHQLRGLGARTALDDFGTGYSSFGYLRSFPFDKLKIDQSFVREMDARPDCRAIVNSVAALALELGIVTTAEGVETREQLNQIRAAGCTEAQGYLFDVPRPAAGIRHWFRDAQAAA